MIFGSKFSAFQVFARPKIEQKNMLGDVIEEHKALVAEFAIHGGEFQVAHPDAPSGKHLAAGIRGHFFDSVEAQKIKGWTDEERELVERRVLEVANREPAHCWLITPAKAPKPWPTYDEMHHNEIAKFAEALGLVAEALAYEADHKKRPSVLAALEERLPKDDDSIESELTAA